ncbi:MAG: LLM class flavin-dependent oxidoreductase [Pseudomonadota bacterium]
MHFGVFLPNGSNGYILSAGSPVYEPTFEHNKAISLEAEKQGLDFVLSMMKFRGFGGETGFWDACLDSFTLMAGLAGVTERIDLYPSIALLSQHPAVTARMVATIDNISRGRCGLNIVTGWNAPEYQQMGLWPGDAHYERRYEYAAEYLHILKDLWRDGRCTFEGEFFKLDDCRMYPTPGREIPIVCAGQSPRGKQFVAESGNYQFVTGPKANVKPGVEDIKRRADGAGRKVGVYALMQMIIADTDDEAIRKTEEIVARADIEAIGNMVASATLDTNKQGTSEALKAALEESVEEGNMVFMAVPTIVGSPATLASHIDRIAEDVGVDGICFSWPDFVPDIKKFGEEVIPLLRSRKAA